MEKTASTIELKVEVRRLSLAELKVKANAIEKGEILEKVQGGGWSDCHGATGGIGKWWRGDADSIKW